MRIKREINIYGERGKLRHVARYYGDPSCDGCEAIDAKEFLFDDAVVNTHTPMQIATTFRPCLHEQYCSDAAYCVLDLQPR